MSFSTPEGRREEVVEAMEMPAERSAQNVARHRGARGTMDRYMKAVLTVIAVALVWLCLKQPIPAAEAKAAPAEAAKPAKAAPVQEVIRAK